MMNGNIQNALSSLKKYTSYSAFAVFSALAVSSCSDPSEMTLAPETTQNGGKGDEIAGRKKKTTTPTPAPDTTTTTTPTTTAPTYQSTISWSGYQWTVRNTNGAYSGPGLNTFSNSTQNVWVDALGQLHLKITYTNGKWVGAEILSQQSFAYGDYIFYVVGQPEKLDKNVVFGMFTWNNNSFQTDANSEIDIEFAKWGIETNYALEYSVQPTAYDAYAERIKYPTYSTSTADAYTTHGFTWTPTEINFKSYFDHAFPTSWLAAAFNFYNTSQPRTKTSGGMTSNPVVIPQPGTDTKVHLNLWLHDTNKDGYGDAPSNGQTAEVIVKKFEFRPRVGA
jgi:hypothetical protein